MFNSTPPDCAKFINNYIQYILDFYSRKCYDRATSRNRQVNLKGDNTMKFFVEMIDRLMSLREVSHVDTDSIYASNLDSAMRIVR